MHLTLITPPLHEPVTMDEAKAYLRLPADIDDPLLPALITAARVVVENHTGRALVRQQWTLQLTPPYPKSFPLVRVSLDDIALVLPLPPLIDIVTCTMEGTGVPFTHASSRMIIPRTYYGNPLEITFWAGYGDTPDAVPAPLRLATLGIIRNLYENQPPSTRLLAPYKVRRLT